MFRGKKYKESAKQIDRGTLYDPKEGLELVCKTASAKFDWTGTRSTAGSGNLRPWWA